MQRTGFGRAIIVTLCCLLVLTAGGGFAPAGVAASESVDGPTVHQQASPTSTNNTTVQHERPDNVSQAGDSQRVSQWLEGRLTGQLQASTIEISQGEYDRAKAYLGDDYDSRLEQYVEVAGETDGTTDDQTAATLRETQTDQQAFANASQAYQQTYEEYQSARRAGNTTAVRQAARDLERLSQQVRETNQSLIDNYQRIENQTGVATGDSQDTIRNLSQNITAQQAVVRTETFVQTRMRLQTNGSAVAFTDPMAITGTITTADGTTVANETANIVVGNRTYRTTTNETGRFAVLYRPVSLPVNATTTTVSYRPPADSPYLGTASTVPVDVTQVSPSLSATVRPYTAGYSDTVATKVVATVRGRPVPSLPLTTTVGDRSTWALTTGQGEAGFTQRVPAAIPAGQRSIRIEHTREALAIGPASTTAPVSIRTTPTQLSVTSQSRGDRVRVRGRLTTTDGDTVSDQTVTVDVGATTRSVVTNRTGWYRVTLTNVSRPEGTNQSVVAVTAQFDGTRTNLESSQATTSVNIGLPTSSASRGAGTGETLSSLQLLALGLLGGCAVVGAVIWVQRREGSDESAATGTADPSPDSATELHEHSRQWLDRARSALADGEATSATVAAYGAVRGRLEEQGGLSNSLTHREFRRACETQLDAADDALFSTLASAYERATFTATIDAETAADAVEAAAELLSPGDESS
ncbi:hypothetical protein [Haloarcula sp. 1CSR25-25]|uniref:hypothetical protein n=1 Tax=Haloarcula sp. 1CSR25-25 TaxID=2862545 RepID=UPI002894DB53|nr:hypothetical protein [Haloarcula sp. 1CSR25-25]MDT3435576.1 hypothetical protein [Haloarcula sp. 1CSR25-25]